VIRTVVIGVDEQLRTLQVSLLSGERDIDVLCAVGPSIPAGTLRDSAVPDVVVVDHASTLLLCRAAGVGHLPQWDAVPVVVTSGGWRETAARGQPSGAKHPGISRVAQGCATLAPAVRAAAAGHRILLLCPDSAEPSPSPSIHAQADSTPCSPREREVLGILAKGATNREIADRLRISETTVRSHVQSLRGKLAARSRAELVARAFERGLAHVAPA
jgi:DNA-binding NarL/FixJ family response regulator